MNACAVFAKAETRILNRWAASNDLSDEMERFAERVINELLVLEAQSGDEKALSALVNRWQRPLLRHALQLTGHGDAAADVVQETWLAIARGLGRLDDPACFAHWALQILSRKAADWVRQRQRDQRLIEHLIEAPLCRTRDH